MLIEPQFQKLQKSMKTSNKGIEFIKREEGFVPRAYKDVAGVWTIGYGHTGGVKCGDVITEKKGEQYLREDVRTAENAVNVQRLPLNQCQFDALVSFVFNVGIGAFERSTLLRIVKQNSNDARIKDEFAKWNKARVGGVLKPVSALTGRRQREAKMYFEKC